MKVFFVCFLKKKTFLDLTRPRKRRIVLRVSAPMTPPLWFIKGPFARRSALHCVVLCLGIAQPWAGHSFAAETCRFTGTTDYNGHAALVTTASTSGGTTRVDVALRFDATTPFWLHLRYLVEEKSEWRNGALQHLDANTRYVFAGRVVRQQWDDFTLTPEGLQARRIEGKRPAEFGRQYPLFAQHWDLGAFGQPWTADFAAASPVRRRDLDLPRTAAMQSPFGMAFYWVRFLQADARHVPVFLPGFKTDKLADVAMTPGSATSGRHWLAGLHHPWLSAVQPSIAAADISADEHLERLSFELHGSAGSAGGVLRQAGCSGAASR